jgi:uncharacterized protein (TIGR02270 family)
VVLMARRAPRARVIREIIEEHAEEAAFLWLQRDSATTNPRYLLRDLAALDERVEAHLDGLRVAGVVGWEFASEAAAAGRAGEVFAAAVLAFESGATDRIQKILPLGAAKPSHGRGLVSALGWLEREAASPHISALLNQSDPVLKRMGIAAAAAHRLIPRADILHSAFASDDPALKARALRATGELGLLDLQNMVRANIKAKDSTARFWAAWSSALFDGHPDAIACLREIAEKGGPFAERAAGMSMRLLAPKEGRTWLVRLVKELRQIRIAVVAAGALADPEGIPFLIDQMKTPAQARVAGESFSLITGAKIAYENLGGEKPEGFEGGPNENPEAEIVAMDRDRDLAWPDPALVQKWWQARQGKFTKGTRYLLGQPTTEENARLALKNGYQRQRAAAALELAILRPGRPLFEIRAPGFRQQLQLA